MQYLLKLFKEEDISSLLKILKGSDTRFLLQFAGPKYKFPLDKKQLLETTEADDYIMFKFIDDNGDFLGHCQLVDIDTINKKSKVGRVLLDPTKRGRGLGRKMIQELINYSRDILGLKELFLRVYDFNESAFKCYQNLGFIETSRESNYFESINETWTSITMTIEL